MQKYDSLLKDQQRKLKNALHHLDYSYRKISKLSSDVKALDEETLETWESFAARFSRVSDLFLTKYVRTVVLKNDPGFEGTLRDFVNQGEKLGIVDSAEQWMGIRELRNMSAHDYTEEELSGFFELLKTQCPRLLAIEKILK